MRAVELTLYNGSKTTFICNSNVNICEAQDEYGKYKCIVNDGNHNNGGWKIKESYETVVSKFISAMEQR